jgi:ABC-2 type transport system ATP-binding protein
MHIARPQDRRAPARLLSDGSRVQWEIPREEISRRVSTILSDMPVTDLTVDEMPLEDVVRRIFKEGSVVA